MATTRKHHNTPFSTAIDAVLKSSWGPPTRLPHTLLRRRGEPSVLFTSLIKSYFGRGHASHALNVFDEMPAKDVVSWTAMISGYASRGDHRHAWRTFIDMFHAGRRPNEYTLSSVLKACKGMGNVSCGGLVHGLAVKLGLQGLIYVDNGLVDMYASCCLSMKNACAVFREIQRKNEVSWTTLISGYTHKGRAERAYQFYREMMLDEEVEGANPFTFSIVISACASTGSRYYGEQMHAAVVKNGFQSSLPVMNSILDMYCRCDCLSEANQCFYEMSEKDLISWNTLIAGYEKLDLMEYLCSCLSSTSLIWTLIYHDFCLPS